MKKPRYRHIKRATLTFRLIHWINAFSIVAAVITGLYIAHPYYQSFIADPAVDKYVMAWNRWIHFIGAILLDGCEIGEECLIGAGALVREGAKIPAGSLAAGIPARVIRPLSEKERQALRDGSLRYVRLARKYAKTADRVPRT